MSRLTLAAMAASWALRGCGPEPAPVDPSLAEDVMPIFAASCAFSSCHGGATPPGYLRLGPASQVTPASVRAALVDVPARADAQLRLVVSGDPDGSFLVRKLEGRFEDLPCAPEACGDRMPQGNPPLAATTGTSFNFRTDPDSAYVVVDRMGMPAVATALIGSSMKIAYNDATPTNDVAGQFRTEQTNLLNGLYNNIADDLTRLGLRLCGRPA